jgi:hypothetical protein
MFVREDWTLFRNLGTLGQKAGVPIAGLPRLIIKELIDNALDAAGNCEASLVVNNDLRIGVKVEDQGDGIPGDDEAIARLFSIRRDLESSKLIRLPSRGALGNGLRVIAGAVLATDGFMKVSTRGRILRLEPQFDTGETLAKGIGKTNTLGTRIEVYLGPSLTLTQEDLDWAKRAMLFVGGTPYPGKTSPHWYDSDAFLELLKASGTRTVRDLIAEFDGCTGKAGRIASEFKGRLACELDRDEADRLLSVARSLAKPVKPERLGAVGAGLDDSSSSYASSNGTLPWTPALGSYAAELPFVVEAWAKVTHDESSIAAFVNRTPITAEISLDDYRQERLIVINGCNLDHILVNDTTKKSFDVTMNIITPYMPITSDGKAPDFLPLIGPIIEVVRKACRKAARIAGTCGPEKSDDTIKSIIISHLEEAIAKAGGGRYRFNQRQLFYAARPFVLDLLGIEPKWGTFTGIITEYEAENGDIPKMYRDPRGMLYHPHIGDEIPLGTLSVEQYERPLWTFNKILYCEKEGFLSILREDGWPERHDCALMTSKGFASRAARDLFDLLGETEEDLYFYCIHDADAYGTMIMQSLQGETLARGARKVHIINLGLEPAEGLAMGLQVEKVEPTVKKDGTVAVKPVAVDVESKWAEWLQTNRIELNAMTTPQFIAWLDRKFADQVGKVVPPAEVLIDRLEEETRAKVNRRLTARILRRARLEDRVTRAMERRQPTIKALSATIQKDVAQKLEDDPSQPWGSPVEQMAREIAAGPVKRGR